MTESLGVNEPLRLDFHWIVLSDRTFGKQNSEILVEIRVSFFP